MRPEAPCADRLHGGDLRGHRRLAPTKPPKVRLLRGQPPQEVGEREQLLVGERFCVTRNAQAQLRQALSFPHAYVVEGGELRVPEAFLKIEEGGSVTDPETRAGIARVLEALAASVKQRHPARQVA